MTSTQSDAGLLSRTNVLTALLACGVVSSVLYVATDVLAAMRWQGYRYADRAASDLFAVGSPTRSFIVPPMTAYNLLILAFGVGVLLAAGPRRSVRISGILLVVYAVASYAGLVLFPLRPDSQMSATEGMALSGVLHSAITVVLVLLMFLFIGFGASARGRAFRTYSIGTILIVLGGGIMAGSQIERVASGLATPWFGIVERTNIYSSLLWVAVFALVLMRGVREAADRSEGARMGARRGAVLEPGRSAP